MVPPTMCDLCVPPAELLAGVLVFVAVPVWWVAPNHAHLSNRDIQMEIPGNRALVNFGGQYSSAPVAVGITGADLPTAVPSKSTSTGSVATHGCVAGWIASCAAQFLPSSWPSIC